MAGTLHLEIATPERLLVKADATEVYIPASRRNDRHPAGARGVVE